MSRPLLFRRPMLPRLSVSVRLGILPPSLPLCRRPMLPRLSAPGDSAAEPAAVSSPDAAAAECERAPGDSATEPAAVSSPIAAAAECAWGFCCGARLSVALKNKTDIEVLNGFKKIFNKSKIRAVRSDNGSEFINKKFTDYLDKNDIKQILSEAAKPQSNGMIERANATVKELIQKSIEMIDKFDWVKNLDKLIDNINNSKHRITGFTPNEIQTAFKNDNKDVLEKAFNKEMKIKKPNISKEVYEVGNLVRIKKPSDKTRQVWSSEVYDIERVYKPKKSYSVYEYKLNEFKDRFKEEELLKIVGNPQNKLLMVEKFVISKLIKTCHKR